MSKWYVTIDKQSSYIDDPDECVWTVSRDPNTTGWCTDSGYSGYGLTKADAEELANAANEIERLRAALQEIAGHKISGVIPDDYNERSWTLHNYVEIREVARAALGEKTDD